MMTNISLSVKHQFGTYSRKKLSAYINTSGCKLSGGKKGGFALTCLKYLQRLGTVIEQYEGAADRSAWQQVPLWRYPGRLKVF